MNQSRVRMIASHWLGIDWDDVLSERVDEYLHLYSCQYPIFCSPSRVDIMYRLGPLSIEQKKRGPVKRNKLEKNKEDMRKPQELQEEDIQRSENETTKNVGQVFLPTCLVSSI